MSKYAPAGGGTYNLGSSIGSTDSTILLSSFTEPVSGTPYTMVLLNTDIAYGTIAPRTSSSEFISFTGITQNSDGSATLTGVTRGLAKKYPFTSDATFKLPHSGQSVFILSDVPQVFNKYVSLENAETISGVKTFSVSPIVPTGGTGTQAANNQDIANAITGASGTATNTTFGTVKLSVAAVSGPNPIAVGDNDSRVSPVSLAALTAGEVQALVGTSGTPSTSNKYVTNDDTASAATASKVARRNSGGDVTVNTTPTNATDAASKAYVDSLQGHVTGVITDLSTTVSANNDITVTTTFTPRLIRLHYWIQGHTSAAGSNIYTAQKGVAIFEGTAFVFSDITYDGQITTDNGVPSGLVNFINTANSTSAPTAGTNSSGNDDIQVTLSIASISSTTFVIRRLTDIGTGSNTSNGRAKIAYEAFA